MRKLCRAELGFTPSTAYLMHSETGAWPTTTCGGPSDNTHSLRFSQLWLLGWSRYCRVVCVSLQGREDRYWARGGLSLVASYLGMFLSLRLRSSRACSAFYACLGWPLLMVSEDSWLLVGWWLCCCCFVSWRVCAVVFVVVCLCVCWLVWWLSFGVLSRAGDPLFLSGLCQHCNLRRAYELH